MTGIPLADWDAVADLIEAALEKPPTERAAFLRASCGNDAVRLQTAERMLEAARRAAGFLDEPAVIHVPDLFEAAVTGPRADTATTMPERIGRHRIIGEIGHGGMGEVYLAERDDAEFERRVAIKVVRGFGGPEMAARFRHERQILASLDHPNIARLYDGGVTEDGRPYLVMEHIEGRPIDRIADERELDIDARLELFLRVCDAVSFAHRKLVVHRDLKPANILVGADGNVKLLDFGVAKLLVDGEADAVDAPTTRIGLRVLTPEYASPEQFLGHAVSTSSDVYSLGILLFELLTGTRPHRPKGAAVGEIERAVLDTEPVKPSTVFAEPASTDGPVADNARLRGTTPERLRRRLRGDLDVIVLKALRRDPEQRYASVDALAEDVRRHRARQPIVARPPAWTYRASRFVRRNRMGVSLTVLLLLSTGVGVAGTVRQSRATAQQAVRAERIRDFLIGVFEVSDPNQARGEEVTARALLDRGSARIDADLADEPASRAEILTVLGTVYRNLGLYDEAQRHYETALDLRRTTGATQSDIVASMTDLASLHFARGDYAAAESLDRDALEMRRRVNGGSSVEYAAVSLDLAAVLAAKGEYEEAKPLYETALRLQQAAGDSAEVASVLNGFGVFMRRTGDAAQSEILLRRAVSLRRSLFGRLSTDVAVSQCNLAGTLSDAGKYVDAIAAYDECIDIRRRILAPDHPDIGLAVNNLAIVYELRGDLETADSLHRQSLEIRRKAFGEFHEQVAGSLNNLAVLAYRRGDYAAAAESFRSVLAQWRELSGPDHPSTLTTMNNLGVTLQAAGDHAAAERVLRDVLAARIRSLGAGHPQVAESHSNLGNLLHRMGRLREAETETRRAIAGFDAAFPDGHPNTASALVNLGRILEAQQRCAEAIPGLARAVSIRVDRLGEKHSLTSDARVWLGRCLIGTGRHAEAVDVLRVAHAALVESNGEDSQATRAAAEALAEAERGDGR